MNWGPNPTHVLLLSLAAVVAHSPATLGQPPESDVFGGRSLAASSWLHDCVLPLIDGPAPPKSLRLVLRVTVAPPALAELRGVLLQDHDNAPITAVVTYPDGYNIGERSPWRVGQPPPSCEVLRASLPMRECRLDSFQTPRLTDIVRRIQRARVPTRLSREIIFLHGPIYGLRLEIGGGDVLQIRLNGRRDPLEPLEADADPMLALVNELYRLFVSECEIRSVAPVESPSNHVR